MLKNLLIKNYALIQELELKPDHELSIITGETGAGKSIMLGAVGLLLGNRADTKALFNEEEKCIVEGIFEVPEHDSLLSVFTEEELDYDVTCIVRREISPGGKSRAFVNDTPVTLEILKKIGSLLIDVHSQHDNLLLGSQDYQLNILDIYAQNQILQSQYKQIYKQYKKYESTYQNLVQNSDSIRKELDYDKFLLDELIAAEFEKKDEQDFLEDELKMLENAEEIRTKLGTVVDILSDSEFAVNTNLRQAVALLSQISNLSVKYRTLKDRVESCYIELKELVFELEGNGEGIDFDPEKTIQIQDRLSLIYKFQKKHSVKSIEELISIKNELEVKVGKVINFEDEIEEAKMNADKSLTELIKCGKQLSEKRLKVIPLIEKELADLLKNVGMPNATVKINHASNKPVENGLDTIKFLFSANKGVPPQELKMVASGGEFSRLMLCVKYILADKTSLPTIIFDEIDTGISGEVAISVGKMIKNMSKQKHQVIAISHLHQIAAKGNVHYFVYKDDSSNRTISKIKKLNDEERIQEIAKMIGGENPSESAIKNAKELLETA